jgi:hypothetical protein
MKINTILKISCGLLFLSSVVIGTFLKSQTNTDTNAKTLTENLAMTSNLMMFSSSMETPEETAKLMESVVMQKPIKVESRMVYKIYKNLVSERRRPKYYRKRTKGTRSNKI